MKKLGFLLVMVIIAMSSFSLKAQELSVGADLVSSYVWRGQYLGSASIQPYVNLGVGDLSLGAWASTDFDNDATEFDLSAGYQLGDFGISFTDYSFGWKTTPYFKNWSDNHIGEIGISYDMSAFAPLTIAYYTNIYGAADEDASGDAYYSAYAELTYSFSIKDVDCSLAAGVTPYEGLYASDFNLVNLAFTASKEVELGSFKIPAFAQIVLNPVDPSMPKAINQDGAYLVFGLSF